MKNGIGFNFHNTYITLPEHFFTRLPPSKVSKPKLIVFNHRLSTALGLNSALSEEALAGLFSGNALPEGAQPIAQVYAGHQFGYFTFLGDGRAHLLGEHVTHDGKRFDVQLKGSGQTPYGLRGDGRAALGPMLREYLISEAMYALGIATTRSLAVVATGMMVLRETALPGAILTRIAASHIRVGTFEFLAAQNDKEGLKLLADYTITRHYPALAATPQPYLELLKMVMHKQIDLILAWMRVGFIHGVMNTDNMSIAGETIDYGPCAFMDTYDPNTVFSAIDVHGRYKFGNQPAIAQWNISRLAVALLPLLHPEEAQALRLAEDVLATFIPIYEERWLGMMRAKLGWNGALKEDKNLIMQILSWLEKEKVDYTHFFSDLTYLSKLHHGQADETFRTWYALWQERCKQNTNPQEARDTMQQSNPFVIPRNHKVEAALIAANQGNLLPFTNLLEILATPYTYSDDIEEYRRPPRPDERVCQTFCGT